jgi:hypothetical protein
MIPSGPLTTIEKAILIVLGIDAAVMISLPFVYLLDLRAARRQARKSRAHPAGEGSRAQG